MKLQYGQKLTLSIHIQEAIKPTVFKKFEWFFFTNAKIGINFRAQKKDIYFHLKLPPKIGGGP